LDISAKVAKEINGYIFAVNIVSTAD
jgi:hypothetical protein